MVRRADMGKMKETLPEYGYEGPDPADELPDPADFEQIFAARVKRERLRRRLRQEDLAARLTQAGVHLHPSAIAKIERQPDPERRIEPRAIRLAEAVVIARIFGLTVERMLTDDDLPDIASRLKELEKRECDLQATIADLAHALHEANKAATAAMSEVAAQDAALARAKVLQESIAYERAQLQEMHERTHRRQVSPERPAARRPSVTEGMDAAESAELSRIATGLRYRDDG